MSSLKLKFTLRRKLLLFLSCILIFNIIIIGVFILSGVKIYQKQVLEDTLIESSKTANLYIREKYVASESESYEEFYIVEGRRLEIELERVLGMTLELYDNNAKPLGKRTDRSRDVHTAEVTPIVDLALDNNIAYKLSGQNVIYMAPIYDIDKQIGFVRIDISQKKELDFYNKLKYIVYYVGALSICLTFILAYLYLSVILRQIQSLKRSVSQVEEGNYEDLKRVNSGDELEELSDGIIDMANTIKTNITTLRDEKTKLEDALCHLKKLEAKQREFIGNITHEFKTPIAVIKSQLDMVNLFPDDEEMIEKALQISDDELQHLNDLVEKTLYLARIERYEFEDDIKEVDIREELIEHVTRLTPKATKFRVNITYDIESHTICVDKDSFKHCIMNLLDNAIKYNRDNGSVYVEGKELEDYYEIRLSDTGIGIPDEHKDRIFDPFYTVDQQRTNRFSSTGLGLSIAKKLIERSQGYICIEDNKDCIGTCFIVGIPKKSNITAKA